MDQLHSRPLHRLARCPVLFLPVIGLAFPGAITCIFASSASQRLHLARFVASPSHTLAPPTHMPILLIRLSCPAIVHGRIKKGLSSHQFDVFAQIIPCLQPFCPGFLCGFVGFGSGHSLQFDQGTVVEIVAPQCLPNSICICLGSRRSRARSFAACVKFDRFEDFEPGACEDEGEKERSLNSTP